MVEAAVSSGSATFAVFWATLRRDLLLAVRHRAEMVNPLVFFLIAITLIPLGVNR